MVPFFLKTETYRCLEKLYKETDSADEYTKELLAKSDIVTLDAEGNLTLNKNRLTILKNCLVSDASMMIKKKYREKTEEICYYLRSDQIILVQKNIEGYIFTNLPTIKYAIGSIADLFWDEITQKEDDSHEMLFFDVINEDNYIIKLNELLSEPEYQLNQIEQEETELLFTENEKNEKMNFFMLVRISEGTAFYYKQEFGKIIYGKCGRRNLTNIISHWILYKHRELIKKLLQEE